MALILLRGKHLFGMTLSNHHMNSQAMCFTTKTFKDVGLLFFNLKVNSVHITGHLTQAHVNSLVNTVETVTLERLTFDPLLVTLSFCL